MGSVWGNNLKVSLFGESHGDVVGIVMDNIPSGIMIDYDYIYSEMDRRKPGKDNISTQRKESDIPKIISGVFNGYTTGAPICVVIENTDNRSRDYSEIKDVARPGHADFTAYTRFDGFNDYRGGGHFSGRLTAPIVFAGALAKCILKEKGILISSHIKSIHNINGDSFGKAARERMKDNNTDSSDILNKSMLTQVYSDLFKEIELREMPVLDEGLIDMYKNCILDAKNNEDSVGGEVECCVLGMEAGIGNPFFNSIESQISSLMFSIPGVKGVEFGSGFDITRMYGSVANDEIVVDDEGMVMTISNNNGGINGGISNSMPIEFCVALKPTPSIYKQQRSINMRTKENIDINIKGRHDPIIVLRAIPVIEAMAAISILDFLL